jgi:elongation factor G
LTSSLSTHKSPNIAITPHSVDVIESDEIPAFTLELATQKRTELIEQLAEVDDEIADLFLNDALPSNTQLATAIRRATVSLKFSPVFLGSAIKNTAVQPLLDGVCAYLASPSEREALAHDTTQPASAPQVELVPAAAAPLVALAFKLEEGRFGQLTYMRVYQGSLKKGQFILHERSGRETRVLYGTLIRSVRARSVQSLASTARLGTRLLTGLPTIQCCTSCAITYGYNWVAGTH